QCSIPARAMIPMSPSAPRRPQSAERLTRRPLEHCVFILLGPLRHQRTEPVLCGAIGQDLVPAAHDPNTERFCLEAPEERHELGLQPCMMLRHDLEAVETRWRTGEIVRADDLFSQSCEH